MGDLTALRQFIASTMAFKRLDFPSLLGPRIVVVLSDNWSVACLTKLRYRCIATVFSFIRIAFY